MTNERPSVLLTRPLAESRQLAEELAERGIDSVVAPLIEIEARADASLDLDGVQALLLTSANGARALGTLTARRDVRVLAVGAATAATARELGFARTESAGGDVDDLVRLVGERLRSEDGALAHVAGSEIAGDLAGKLEARGFQVRRTVAYAARAVATLPAAAGAALGGGQIDAVLLFSPRTAATFVSLVRAAGLADALASVEALCLSASVADKVAGLAWGAVRIADRPEQAALLALLPGTQQPETTVDEPRSEQAAVETLPGTPVTEPARPRRRRWPLLVALIVAGGLGIGGYWVSERLRQADLAPRVAALEVEIARLADAPAQAPAVAPEDVAALAARIDALEADVRTLAAAPGAPDPALAQGIDQAMRRIADLGSRIDSLAAVPAAPAPAIEDRLMAIESAIGAGVARSDVARLDQRAEELASDVALLRAVLDAIAARTAALETAGQTRPLVALVVAVGQLREALRGFAPFTGELAAVSELAKSGDRSFPEIAALEPFAAAGIATAQDLARGFPDVVAAVLTPPPASDAAWYDRALDRLRGLVTVRRLGANVAGDDAAARLARAEAALAAGDLAAAGSEVAAIGSGDPITTAWLAGLGARAAADAALATLGERVIAAVSAAAP